MILFLQSVGVLLQMLILGTHLLNRIMVLAYLIPNYLNQPLFEI